MVTVSPFLSRSLENHLFQLDFAQRAVLDIPLQTSAVVLGAPGSGKTTTLVEFIADRVHRLGLNADEIMVIAPTRTAASALRDRIAVRVGMPTNGSMARTVNSLAFEVVRDDAIRTGSDMPVLLTGAEHDHIIAELLCADNDDGTGPNWPEPLSYEVRTLRGFRTELRDLMMRCVEYGIDSQELRRLGEKENRPEWVAAAAFSDNYDRVKASYRNAHYDASELVRTAASIVAASKTQCGVLSRIRLMVVDDAHESTHATLTLLRAFVHQGVNIIAFGDPDITTGAFRGACADSLGRLSQYLDLPHVPQFIFNTVYRHGAEIRHCVSQTTSRIGAAAAGKQRAAVSHRRLPPALVRTAIAVSPSEHISLIARRLRERHIFDNVPWNNMAVILRTTSAVQNFVRGLNALDVPTRSTTPGNPLRDHFIVRSFMLALEIALKHQPLTASIVTELLTSPLGGLDSLGLRDLRASLRHAAIAGEHVQSIDSLLVEAFEHPAVFSLLNTRASRCAERLANNCATLRAEADEGKTIEELLWIMWEHSGLADHWQEQSRRNGVVADDAHNNLDAMVALFASAQRFVERNPHAPASLFVEQLRDSDIPEDTLAPRSISDAVTIGTPSALIGTDFDTVVIANLHEGVWPNLRLRSSLLGVTHLRDAHTRHVKPSHMQPRSIDDKASYLPPDHTDARLDVLHDELRMFAQAVSRARREILFTAVSDTEHTPSPFFRFLPAPSHELTGRSPLSLRGTVGALRRELTAALNTPESPERAHAAAASLARLANANLIGAHPHEWYGLASVTSHEPLYNLAAAETVRVSPSRMNLFEACPLDWLIHELGGSRSNISSGLGSIIHSACEHASNITYESLWEYVHKRWEELPFEAAWQSQATQHRARDMVQRLSHYLHDFARSGGELLGTETAFQLLLPLDNGGAVLRGSIDRIERNLDGSVTIVDLKTGTHNPTTDAGVRDNSQLAAYQLAFASGVIPEVFPTAPFAGAKLVIISGKTKKPYAAPAQPPFDEQQLTAFTHRIQETAYAMAQAVFSAHLSSHCLDSWSFGTCRIHVIKAVSA